MPDTRVIDEPIVVSTPALQDTFYVAHWSGSVFVDAQVSLGILTAAIATAITNQEITETPTGIINGVNVNFLLSHLPAGNSLTVYKNGLLQKVGDDYTISIQTLTFVPAAVPLPGDKLTALYHT